MQAKEAASSRGRAPPAGGRKTLEDRRRERRLSADRRKSGPKATDVESMRQDGKAGRRRLSDNHRRTSKGNKAATLRRERSSLRPPLVGHPGMGRASLPARVAAPLAAAKKSATPPAAAAAAAAAEPAATSSQQDVVTAVAMDQEEEEGEKPAGEAGGGDDAHWTPEMVTEAARVILGGDRQHQLRSLRWLRVVLSLSESPPAEEVVRAGLLPKLVDFLRQTDCAELRPEALCALTNIASTECTKAVAMEPATLPALVELLSSSDLYLREQSAWCLGNIAADGVEMRDLVLKAGVLDPLLLSLSPSQHGCTSFMRTGTWALNNLCRGLPPPPLSTVVPIVGTLRPVIEAANTGDAGTLIDAGWVLYHITRGGSDRIDAVQSAGLLSMMPDMLLHENHHVVRPVIRAMDNLACTSVAYRGALIEAGVLDPLVETLGHDSSKVRGSALRLLSCIAAGSAEQVDAVVSTADVIPSVMVELEEGNALCKREAAWVFLNMCECSREPGETIIPELVGHGVIAAVCENLSSDSDAETLLVMLSLLFTILDEGGLGSTLVLSEYTTLVEEAQGFDKIMGIANDHDDMEIYDKAMDIIQAFHDSHEDEDDDDDELVFGVAHAKATATAAAATRACAISSDDDDDDSSDMSDDSLSDDSFHRELAGAASGPITPPPAAQRSPSEASPIAPTAKEGEEEEQQQPGRLFEGEKISPRQPLGTVQQQHLLATGGSSALSPLGGGVAAGGGKRAVSVRGCEVGDMER